MGAAQSASDPQDHGEAAAPVKTSYYELLDLDRQANELDIKKAYRKKALELHPDRNYGNVEEATRRFADVQTAYEVLSDPQERSWYDSHEAAILRGDDIDAAANTAGSYDLYDIKFASGDDVAHLLGKFGRNVSFTDEPNGFFGFLRQTFARLAQEEEEAAIRQDSEAGMPTYPDFGSKADTYENVVKYFYAAWAGFATRKSFSWRDKYKLSEAPDRRYKRMMEKENRKFRDEGIRDFNDAVRSLVAFVRKRDPRFNAQSEAARQQTLRDAATLQAARARAANQAALAAEMPAWSRFDEHASDDGQQGTFEDSEDEDEEEDEVEEYDCVACKKVFKSENQWQAHERSKKHQKAVKAVRKQMLRENTTLDLGDELPSRSATPATTEDGDNIELDSATEKELSEQHSALEVRLEETSVDDEPSVKNSSSMAAPTSKIQIPDSAVLADNGTDTLVPPALPTLSLSDEETMIQTPKQKTGKAAQKRAKKAAAAAVVESSEIKSECATCHALFSSKTRLFQHIKDHGHAAPKTVAAGGKKKGRKG